MPVNIFINYKLQKFCANSFVLLILIYTKGINVVFSCLCFVFRVEVLVKLAT